MATYIMLMKFTTKGIEDVKDAPAHIAASKQAFRDAGAEVKQVYGLLGRYDMIAVAEAPDDTTIAKLALMISADGCVRTETLRAFTEDELCALLA